ncbi:putative aminoacrylate peracid reductase RutC [Pseudovibrio sp. Ad13]|uniref:RidA family protein n=1 Tax=unclassified Pseudovibrio TaxID=2627060 RepID=UPI0007AE962C|nr:MULTISPECIES: RidA family protein [unclassified Pseudovibrio]KZK79680.1 putative aminoacrylate peracid reductase RutC [Pseudovibrio sp. Ad13]KZK94416.1 putative aminoacrylate peracid reductase RutC [Pseudovibrio sp. W74]KZL04470.1 putative aminoacrylate peracid reductase RutC [Pseudovibrio sp. Ad14]
MSERSLISSGSPFEKAAGYSRAVVDGDLVHVSGTTGYDYSTMKMPEDVGAQAVNALETIKSALSEAGCSLEDVVRARYYVTDRSNVEAVFAVLGEYFGEIRPAATMVICALIKEEMKVEIEVMARRS